MIEHYSNGTEAMFGSTAFYYLLQPEPIGGDANFDGRVGYLDLGILATHYGLTALAWSEGDFNGDGAVDYLDLGILATRYGYGCEERLPVPEPAAATLLALGAAALIRTRRR